jgi:hypothetical protein
VGGGSQLNQPPLVLWCNFFYFLLLGQRQILIIFAGMAPLTCVCGVFGILLGEKYRSGDENQKN